MVAPHEPALESIEAGVRRRSGAVVIGPAGVGKTALLRAAAERLGPGGSVTGTASDAAIPFGAFRRLIDIPAIGKTAAIVRAAREKLRDQVLFVDDAHLLDPLSATLLYQLGLTGTANLVVSVAAGTPVPAPLAALWEDDLPARIDLQPPGHDDTRVAAQVESFIGDLPAPARHALEYLAVCDPLPSADLRALAGDEAVAAAGAVVTVEGDVVHTGHPLFVDAVRDRIGGPDCAGCAPRSSHGCGQPTDRCPRAAAGRGDGARLRPRRARRGVDGRRRGGAAAR